jgi:hypothetical protein
MGGRIDSLEARVGMNLGLLVIVSLGGCALMIGIVVLVVWAIMDNAHKNKPSDQ